MSRMVLAGGRVIGGTASRARMFDFIDVPKATILQRHTVFQGASRCSARCTASIFFKLFQVERLVFRIPLKSPKDRVTRIANRDLPNQKISKKVRQRRYT